MDTDCTYCGSDVERHDPVSVADGVNPDPGQSRRFCNYACLAAYIEDEELVYGAACEWNQSVHES